MTALSLTSFDVRRRLSDGRTLESLYLDPLVRRSRSNGGDAYRRWDGGRRDLSLMQAQKRRFAGYDGRLADLDSQLKSSDMPLVRDNWAKHFTWLGVGPMPEPERQKLHDIVARAHEAGYRIRSWATPDQPGATRDAIWQELIDAGVDHINTDELAGLETFLRAG